MALLKVLFVFKIVKVFTASRRAFDIRIVPRSLPVDSCSRLSNVTLVIFGKLRRPRNFTTTRREEDG